MSQQLCCTNSESIENAVSQMEEEITMLQKELREVRRVRQQLDPAQCSCCGHGAVVSSGGGEPGQQVLMANQQRELEELRQIQQTLSDKVEDYKANAEDMTEQMTEYRAKYLQAQQTAEEQQCVIERLKRDNAKAGEHVNAELQRVKKLFQEKIQELSPLPFILEATQLKCQETQQEKALLEESVGSLSLNLAESRDREKRLQEELQYTKDMQKSSAEENERLRNLLRDLQTKHSELKVENDCVKTSLATNLARKQQLELKLAEHSQLAKKLESLKEETTRQQQRLRERFESQKRALQERVAGAEQELAQSRAAATAAQKDKDRVRKQMQMQLNTLMERFREAQTEIEALRDHVAVLKSSYATYCEDGSTNNNAVSNPHTSPSMLDHSAEYNAVCRCPNK